jgi:uncharacterized tellurite resistance protein B-like protein
MARSWLLVNGMERENQEGLDRLIARLAVAVIAADRRIAPPEMASLERLDRIGFGAPSGIVREEIERAVREPVDVAATCAALPRLGEDAATLVLTTLAELVTSDRVVALRERDVFRTIAGHLGIGAAAATRILEAAISPNGVREAVPPPHVVPDKHPAFRMLGLEPGASRSRIETTYLQFVQRYDPLRMAEELGPALAALAVRRLATITDAYETALATLQDASSRA